MEKIKLKEIRYKVTVGFSGYEFMFRNAAEAMQFFESAVNHVEDKEKVNCIQLEAILVESEYDSPVMCKQDHDEYMNRKINLSSPYGMMVKDAENAD